MWTLNFFCACVHICMWECNLHLCMACTCMYMCVCIHACTCVYMWVLSGIVRVPLTDSFGSELWLTTAFKILCPVVVIVLNWMSVLKEVGVL